MSFTKRYTLVGALLGIVMIIADFTEWRGPIYSEWGGEYTSYNLGRMIGAIFFPAAIGLVIGMIRDYRRRSSVR